MLEGLKAHASAALVDSDDRLAKRAMYLTVRFDALTPRTSGQGREEAKRRAAKACKHKQDEEMTPPPQQLNGRPSLQLLLLLLLLLPSAQAFVPARVPTAPATSSSTSATATSSLFRRSRLPPTLPSSARTPLPCLWQIRSDQQHTEDYFRFIEGKEVRTCRDIGHETQEWKRQCARRVGIQGRKEQMVLG